MFIPAWWWYQSQSIGDRDSVIVDMEFPSHSEMFNLINDGIEGENILSNDNKDLEDLHEEYHQREKLAEEMKELND